MSLKLKSTVSTDTLVQLSIYILINTSLRQQLAIESWVPLFIIIIIIIIDTTATLNLHLSRQSVNS